MHDRPGGAELLRVARRVLREELVALLPEERRYHALMVANAMAIAARELELGEEPLRRELAELAAFYGEPAPADPRAAREAVFRLSARLAADIRAGALDDPPERREAAWTLLLESVRRKLRVSNPRALAAAGLE